MNGLPINTSRGRSRMRIMAQICILAISALATDVNAQETKTSIHETGVIGVEEEMLAPDYWIERTPGVNRVLMTRSQIDALNERTLAEDRAMVDVSKLHPTITRAEVLKWIDRAAQPPIKTFVNSSGNLIPQSAIVAVIANIGKASIRDTSPIRYGLSV